MSKKTNTYSFAIGLWKCAKNSVILLVPFAIALLATVPVSYAWLAGPLVYFLKNMYEIKSGKKLLH